MAELQLDVKKQRWLMAQRWRQHMKACLASSGLTFDEWLVLDSIWSLVSRTKSAVSQAEVARRLELDALNLWHVLAVLDQRGLVSRGRTLSGKAWRVSVTNEGVELLRALEPSLERVSALGQ